MKIEIRNVVHSARLSEETSNFTAAVFIDGNRAGVVQNHGRGGCNDYFPFSLKDTLDNYCKGLPPVELKGLKKPDGSPVLVPADADILIDDLLMDHLHAKDLKRKLASNTLVKVEDGRILQVRSKFLPPSSSPEFAEWKAKNKVVAVLNELPFADALKIYKNFAKAA